MTSAQSMPSSPSDAPTCFDFTASPLRQTLALPPLLTRSRTAPWTPTRKTFDCSLAGKDMARHPPKTDGGPCASWSCHPRVCIGRRAGPVSTWSGQSTPGKMKDPRVRCHHYGSLFSDEKEASDLGVRADWAYQSGPYCSSTEPDPAQE